MKDNTLLNISVFVSIFGIIFLFIILNNYKIPEYEINNITDKNLGEKIKVSGNAERINFGNSTTFIELSQKCSITVVSFEKINITKNSYVEITGTLQEYKGQKEIIADEIKIKK